MTIPFDPFDTSGGSLGSTGEPDSGEWPATGETYPDLPNETCEVLQIEGESVLRPVDIIFAVDTSGSMAQEAESVAANMNAFSQLIVDSGVDAHVVLIAAPTMCIAPPLGSGQCSGADENPDRFVHIDTTVGSNDALAKILETAPQWKPYLRPGAAKHVVVVSDDDSAMKLPEFHTKFSALDVGDYSFHAIVSALDPDTSECAQDLECCILTAEKGLVYLQLVAKTGGVFGDLCEQDFAPVFSVMAEHIADSAPIACSWPLPEADGSMYDYSGASVSYALDGTNFATMDQVGHAGGCPQGKPAWYYDNAQAPSEILACPWTCSDLGASSTTRVHIELSCLLPPEG